MRVVIALGGNALLRPRERPEIDVQRRNLAEAARAVAPIAREHALVLTHGNGPQIGWLALQAEAAAAASHARPAPLDVLGAESEALIGCLLEQELAPLVPGRAMATLLTHVEVDPDDPAFRAPTKPIGPTFDAARASALAGERGWSIAPVQGGFRRVVPSPEPLRIREDSAIRELVHAGVIVICAGGGGVPVVATAAGGLRGVEAVIDKDLTSALLARELDADALLLLTDVEGVLDGWPSPSARVIRCIRPRELRHLGLPAGSMGPKAEAAARFVEWTGRRASIGRLENAGKVLEGEVGPSVVA